MRGVVTDKPVKAKGIRHGGRAVGRRNRKTQEQIDWVELTGETPLQFMIRVMRDEKEDLPIRLAAAKEAAPYVHQKLAQKVEVKGEMNITNMSDDEIERRLLELIGEAGGIPLIEGTLAPQEAA